MVNKLVLLPIIILAIGALIEVGTISGSGAETISPYSETCKLPSNWFSGVGTFSTGISQYTNCQITNFVFGGVINSFAFELGIVQFPTSTLTTNTSSVTTSTFTTVICTTGDAHGCAGVGTLTGTVTFTNTAQPQQSSLNPYQIQIGFLAIVLLLVSTIIIAGISIAGSGINPASIYILFKTVGYTLVWLILSSLATPLFYNNPNTPNIQDAIPQPYGSLLYLFLTLVYLLGIYQDI